ncbi:MAG: hypothetical protein RR499_01825 [Mucinivorans sp.]
MKNIHIHLVWLSMALAVGCSERPLPQIDDNTMDSKKISVPLFISVAQNDIVNTRSGSGETTVDDNSIYVFTFDAAGSLRDLPTKVLYDKGLYWVVLTPSNEPRQIFVVANDQGAILSSGIQWSIGSTNLLSLRLALLTPSRVAAGASHIGSNNMIHTMSASVTLPKLTTSTAISLDGTAGGGSLPLVRVTSKVTIRKNDAAGYDTRLNDLVLVGSNIARSPTTSHILPVENNQTPTVAFSGVGGDIHQPVVLANAQGSEIGALYSYESTFSNNTCVVLKATYKGVVGYYRLDLLHLNADGSSQTIVFMRNTHYMITINHVTSPGYRTAQEALDNYASNQVIYSIAVYDQTDTSNDIVSSGMLSLGLLNSQYIVYANEGLSSLEVTRVAYNYVSTIATGAVTTTAPGITLITTTLPSNSDSKFVSIKATLSPTCAVGSIWLRLGSILREVPIIRRDKLPYNASPIALGRDVVQAYVVPSTLVGGVKWLHLSSDSGASKVQSITNPAGANVSVYFDLFTDTTPYGGDDDRYAELMVFYGAGKGTVRYRFQHEILGGTPF